MDKQEVVAVLKMILDETYSDFPEQIEALKEAIRIIRGEQMIEVINTQEYFIEHIQDDLRTYAKEWNVIVAEEGLEVAKEEFLGLVTTLRKFGIQNLTTKYPNGEEIIFDEHETTE